MVQVGGVLTDHLRVHRVTLYESGKEPEAGAVFSGVDELPQYAGPVFEELDDALQNAFYEYLEDRGIHDDLAATLSDYARYVRSSIAVCIFCACGGIGALLYCISLFYVRGSIRSLR